MTREQRAKNLHLKALKLAEGYRRQEALIIQILQDIDHEKAYYFYNCKSLFEYATIHLKLSEAVAYAFITVSRKSKEVPELQKKINAGEISVHKAKKICSVLQATNTQASKASNRISPNEMLLDDKNNQQNKIRQNHVWLEKAEKVSTRQLEIMVAEQSPETFQKKEFRKAIGNNMESLTLRLNKEQIKKLERVKEILSSQKGKGVQLLDCFDEMLNLFIEKRDPVKKADRAEKRKAFKAKLPNKNKTSQKIRLHQRKSLSSALKHEVYLRNGGKCCYVDSQGQGCESRQWLHIHHKQPLSLGGENKIENLDLRCSSHHRQHHFLEKTYLKSHSTLTS